jgi:hypothetical protein
LRGGHDAIWSQSVDQASGDVVRGRAALQELRADAGNHRYAAEAADVTATGDLQTVAASLAGKPLADINRSSSARWSNSKGIVWTAAALGIGVRAGDEDRAAARRGRAIAGRQHGRRSIST